MNTSHFDGDLLLVSKEQVCIASAFIAINSFAYVYNEAHSRESRLAMKMR